MDSRSRLLTLMGGSNFNFDTEFDDLARFVKVWNRLMTQAAACSDEKQGRILELIYLNMAEMLQPAAIAKYGDASGASVRRVLLERYLEPGVKLGVERIIQLLREEAIANPTLEDCQRDQICKFYDLVQQSFIDFVVNRVAQYRFLPVDEVPQIAMVISDMFRKAGDVNNIRCN